jgi:hypothetical protein
MASRGDLHACEKIRNAGGSTWYVLKGVKGIEFPEEHQIDPGVDNKADEAVEEICVVQEAPHEHIEDTDERVDQVSEPENTDRPSELDSHDARSPFYAEDKISDLLNVTEDVQKLLKMTYDDIVKSKGD